LSKSVGGEGGKEKKKKKTPEESTEDLEKGKKTGEGSPEAGESVH